jgi:hypothetical protein
MKIRLKIGLGGILLLSLIVLPAVTLADTLTNSGSIGLEGTISGPPPSSPPTVSTPSNGASYNTSPITINGICKNGLLVKVFDNGVFVGSAVCTNGSYSLQIALFPGQNQITVNQYDALGQSSPVSSTIQVTYVSAQFVQAGNPLSITSSYAERGASPGTQLQWPIVISGGIPPYAISVDWGDGSPETLISQSLSGTLYIQHTYKTAGVYTIIVRATDKDNDTSFLQLVGQATGQVTSSSNSSKSKGQNTVTKQVIIWPMIAMIPLIAAAYWFGGEHKVHKIRQEVEKAEDQEK